MPKVWAGGQRSAVLDGTLVATALAIFATGCGSSSVKSSPPTPSASATASTSSGGGLTAGGAITATLTEQPGQSCGKNPSGDTTASLRFRGGADTYVLQLSLPAGTTTLPDKGGKALVSIYNTADAKKQWAAGTTGSPGEGTVTVATDGSGTVDATLGYAPPSAGSPALGPVMLSGSWTCT